MRCLHTAVGHDLRFFLVCGNFADSDTVIKPYKVVNVRFMPLYGIITGSLSAYISQASYSGDSY